MGADRRVSWGTQYETSGTAKIAEVGGLLIGVSGARRLSNLAQTIDPPMHHLTWDVDRWVALHLIPTLRAQMAAHGYDKQESNKSVSDGNMLVAVGGRCYEIASDWAWTRNDSNAYAIGSGSLFAKGAVSALTRQGVTSPAELVRQGLEVAAAHDIGVGPPFDVFVQRWDPAGVACGVCRPEPVPECCTDGTCPTCAPMMAWTDYRKDYQPRDTVTASKAFRAGWEASREYHRDTPEPDPEPVPEWRALVNEVKLPRDLHPLAAVLYDLHCLDVFPRAKKSLARIVAVAEREVGDGWQADPSGWVATPALHALLRCAGPGTAWPETDWQGLANAASAWLRDLTDGAE